MTANLKLLAGVERQENSKSKSVDLIDSVRMCLSVRTYIRVRVVKVLLTS